MRSPHDVDLMIVSLVADGRLVVDSESGYVFAPRSNRPHRPVGALTKKGYLRACIQVNRAQWHFMVHRIVWVATHGPLPDGWEVDHLNRNKIDNRLDNLEAVPGPVNMERATAAGAFVGVGRRDGIRDAAGRFGKKAAGRELDGVEWNEYPS